MSAYTDSSHPARVVVAGGGVAGVAVVLGLHELAADRTAVTWLSPDDFVLRYVAVAEPFAAGHAEPIGLGHLAWEVGADLLRDGLASVQPSEKSVTTSSGEQLSYDLLVVA